MTHPPQTTDTPQRDTTNLASCVTKSSFLHIQDALAIGKIALWVGKYSRRICKVSPSAKYRRALRE